MSLIKINKLIECIEQEKPLNLKSFQRQLERFSFRNPYSLEASDFKARKVDRNRYVITTVNPDLMTELRKLSVSLGNDRISAARQNHSHDYKVSCSLLFIRRGHNPPEVVMIRNDESYEYFSPTSPYLLIIENRELFVEIERTLHFLMHQGLIDTLDFDIVWGAGKEIANNYHRAFLKEYQKIYGLFDLDRGGLTIAKSLLQLVSVPFYFLVPADIDQRLARVTEICDNAYIDEVLQIAKTEPRLASYAWIIEKHQKVIEQEEYLYVE